MKDNAVRKSIPVMFAVNPTQGVDQENGIIKGVVIIQKGEDKVGDNIDQVFLEQCVKLGNGYPKGLKSRFGHPNMCDTTLGTYIGRYKDFRIDNDVVKADLYMDPVAKESPKGDLYTYCLKMAESNSDMFGNSIHFRTDEPEYYEVKSENGDNIMTEFIRMKSFIASDLVDSPAATTDLFRSDTDFALTATEFLDENPKMFELLESNPGVLKAFLDKYAIYKQSNNMDKSINDKLKGLRKFFGLEKETSEVPDVVETPESTEKESVETEQGTLYCNGAIAPGSAVYTDPEMTTLAPAGTYTSPSGDYVVGESGTVSSVPSTTPADPEPAFEALKEQITSLEAKVKEQTTVIDSSKETIANAIEALETAKKQVEDLTAKVNRTEDEIRDSIKSEFTPEGSKRSDKSQTGKETSGGRFGPESPQAKQAMLKTGSDITIDDVK